MTRATLHDVAREAGVHFATASRALNESSRHKVRPETVERVLAAAQAVGYVTNLAARTLKTRHSRAVGVVLPDLLNPSFALMVTGIEEVLRRAGYSTWVVNTDDDTSRATEAVLTLGQRDVDGLILATARLDDPMVRQLRAESPGVPFVLVNRRIEDREVSSVTVDGDESVRLAVEHLAGLGHRQIVLVAGPQDVSTGRATVAAFERHTRALGLSPQAERVVVATAFTAVAGRSAMRERLGMTSPLSAVLAGNDLIALGCLDALADRGLRCPDDVSVMGFNDMPLIDRVSPPLTTISIPFHELGSEAARVLLDAVRCPSGPPRTTVLTPTLVVRRSTAPPRDRLLG